MGVVPVGHNSIIDLKDVPCEEVDMGGKKYFGCSSRKTWKDEQE